MSERIWSICRRSLLTKFAHFLPESPTRSTQVWSSSLPKYSARSWRETPAVGEPHQPLLEADEALVDRG